MPSQGNLTRSCQYDGDDDDRNLPTVITEHHNDCALPKSKLLHLKVDDDKQW